VVYVGRRDSKRLLLPVENVLHHKETNGDHEAADARKHAIEERIVRTAAAPLGDALLGPSFRTSGG
jgi:hypothetical protein